MIYVAGLPRSGTSFPMELFHHLGDRIAYWFNEAWRGGHEDPEFNELAFRLGQYLLFSLPGDARDVLAAGCVTGLGEPSRITPEEIRDVLAHCWSAYEAIKDITGGFMLALACEFGWRPQTVILCLRHPAEIIEKYGYPLLSLSMRLRNSAHAYAVLGQLLATCIHYDLPYRVAHFPRFVHEPGNAWEVLGGLHGESEESFRFAWEKSHR